MCTTNIYTYLYPDGRREQYSQPTLCAASRDGQVCVNNYVFQHPSQLVNYGESGYPYVTQPPSTLYSAPLPPTPSNSRGSRNRPVRSLSGSPSRRKRSSDVYVNGQKVLDLNDRPERRRRERIVLVDGPPLPRPKVSLPRRDPDERHVQILEASGSDADDENPVPRPSSRQWTNASRRSMPASTPVEPSSSEPIELGSEEHASKRLVSRVDEDSSSDASDTFDTMSVASIATSLTSVSGGGVVARAASDAFIDLLYSTADLRRLMQPALDEREVGSTKLTNGVRKLLKVLARDLSNELPDTEHIQISKFFMASSRRLSDEIVDGLRDERKGKKPKDGKDEKDDSSDAEMVTESEGDEPDPQTDISGMRDLVAFTHSFRAFVSRLYDLANPSFESRLKELVEWQDQGMENLETVQQIKEVVSELLYSRPENITRSDGVNTSWVDKPRVVIGTFLPDEWDWWPFSSPRIKVSPGYAGLMWTCVCGDTRRAVVPETFARRVVKIRKQTLPASSVLATTPSATFTGPSATPQSISQAQHQHNLQPIPFQPFTSNPQMPVVSTDLPAAVPMPMTSRYVMFVVDSDRLHLRVIESQSLCNEQLFRRLRLEYRQMKGWFKSWFGLMTFSHCEFYKFEAWTHGRYCERGRGIPPIGDQHYYYQPRPMDNEPPISKHEFYDRFYRRIGSETCIVTHGTSCSERDAVDRIPQKKDLINITTNRRPQFWGIIAREKKSGLRMLIYILASCIPGLVFFVLWLFALGNDSLQDASVLLMISFSLLGILYAAQLF